MFPFSHVEDKYLQKNLPLSKNNKKVENFDCIILGAGIAGLGAAKVLKSSKINFIVLEAQNRVGGRINTVEMKTLKGNGKKIYVDSGAQWIHGRNNKFYEMAEQFNLIRKELSDEASGDFIREDGYKFDDDFVKKVDFNFGYTQTDSWLKSRVFHN